MKRTMVMMAVALAGLFGAASTALAQTTTAAAPNVELSAGAQFLRFEGEVNYPKGWYADVAKSLGQTVSLVGQVTGSYRSDSVSTGGVTGSVSSSVHTFMGGVRVSARMDKSAVFAQAMVGAMRIGVHTKLSGAASANTSGSDSSKAGVVGVGWNGGISRNMSFRLGGDYVRVFPDGQDSAYVLRLTAGLVFAFGSR